MPQRRMLTRTDAEHTALTHLRDHAPQPYLRERASAPRPLVARQRSWRALVCSVSGIPTPSTTDAITGVRKGWIAYRFVPGAGASPLFLPPHPTPEAAQDVLHPEVRGLRRTSGCDQRRWTLAARRQACFRVQTLTRADVHQLLDRLAGVWKRARHAIGSPAPHDAAQHADIAQIRRWADAAPGQIGWSLLTT